MKKTYLFSFVLMLLFYSISIFPQNFSVSGKITDAKTNESLVGANVYIRQLQKGAVSNESGDYIIDNIAKGTYELTVSYVGYVTKNQIVNLTENLVLNFQLTPNPVLLQETVVKGTRATLRETPVAFTEVQGADLEFKLSSRDVPQMLNTTPNVYSSVQGGASGDANLYVRGFNQRDIAIMINGVPVNDMENGWVYWSNWAGLGDVTSSIQVQRGLGASPYSVNAIGGIVNVITQGVGHRTDFVRLKTEFGSENLQKTSVAFSTNLSSRIGLTALVSKKTWDGYADATPIDEFTYFFSIGGVFGNHSLEFTGVGSPQEHGQRIYRQTINTYYTRGFNYNQNWGKLNDEVVWETYNKYHKPQFNLNWNWQMSEKSILSTIAYFSFGNGYGTGRIGSSFPYRADGTINFDAVYASNSTNIDTNYSSTLKRSKTALRKSVNNHLWTGLLSTFKYDISESIILNVGFDGRYYKGEHYRTISNLIGGDYFVDNSDKNNPNKMARIGDKVAYYNDGLVRQFGGFAQLEYKNGRFTTFINGSGSITGFKRKDYFNFLDSDPKQETDWEDIGGFTAKGGVNFNIDQNNNIFVNAGYFSRAPIFDNVYDFANNKFQDIRNEKIFGVEAGYGFSSPIAALLFNGYYTSWKDRAISRSVTNLNTGETFYYNLLGADQEYYGLELEGRLKLSREFELEASGSWAHNKYVNDVHTIYYPEDDPNQQKVFASYVNDLWVGDFPMINAAFQVHYRKTLSNGASFYFNPVYTLHSMMFANFDPNARTNEFDRTQSWRIPDYYLVDVHVGYEVLFNNLFFKKLNIGLHIFNALNNKDYIVDGQDGLDHTANSALVFYGRNRWWNLSFSFDF